MTINKGLNGKLKASSYASRSLYALFCWGCGMGLRGILLVSVSTPAEAKAIAELLWMDPYGDCVLGHKPYRVFFDEQRQVWLVKGSLPSNVLGGVPYVLIEKETGKVLSVWHTQ